MDYIKNICDKLVKKHKTRNPILLAELCGINIWRRDLGELKGFYLSERRSRYIVVNSRLDDITAKIVTAHELGHDKLHRKLSEGGMRELTLFLGNDKTENQANTFAAELMISDEEVLALISDYADYERVAYELRLPIGLLGFKIESLKQRGITLPEMKFKKSFLR